MMFYHDDTVEFFYMVQVDIMISVVVHDNHMRQFMLQDNAN